MAARTKVGRTPNAPALIVWRITCNVGLPVLKIPLRLWSQARDSPALLVDVLLGVEPGDQRLDALFLCIRRGGSLCLLGIVARTGEIAF